MADDNKWNPTPTPTWAETVLSWPWEPWNVGGGPQEGWKKAGDCPVCGHRMAVYQEFAVRVVTPEEQVAVMAGCNCGRAHEGRPDGEWFKGCGQQAQIEAHP